MLNPSGAEGCPDLLGERNTLGEPSRSGAPFRLAGEQHLAAQGSRPGALDQLQIGARLGREGVWGCEEGGSHIDRQHAVAEPPWARTAASRAREGAGQEFAQEGEARPFMLAERPNRASALRGVGGRSRLNRAVERARVSAEPSVRLDE